MTDLGDRTIDMTGPVAHDGDTKSPEEQVRAVLASDPHDFNAWVQLVGMVESKEDLLQMRATFDAFLGLFPFCFGYWKRYADAEQRHGNIQKVLDVYERAVAAVPYSVDMWIHYCAHVASQPDNSEAARAIFERALSVCGLDYLASNLWDKYMEFEFGEQEYGRLTQLYHRVLAIPTLQLERYIERYRQHAITRPLEELYISAGEEEEIATELQQGGNADGQMTEEQVLVAKRELIMKRREALIAATTAANTLRKQYEAGVRRPYFHIVPLDEAQLANWRAYLAYEVSQGQRDRIRTLHERCLISCALYPEFWQRYALWLEKQDENDAALKLLERSAEIFNSKNATAYLMLSQALESRGDTKGARAALKTMSALAPTSLEHGMASIGFARRQGNTERVLELYNQLLESLEEDTAKAFLYLHLARYQVYTGQIEAARATFTRGTTAVTGSKNLWLAAVAFETSQGGPEAATRVSALFDAALQPGNPLSPLDHAELSFAKREWFADFGSKVEQFRSLQYDYLTDLNAASVQENGGTKRARDECDDDDTNSPMAKRNATGSGDTS